MNEPIKNCTIIGIAGKKRSGKSTIAEYMGALHGYTTRAFADPLYDALEAMFGQDFRSPYWQQHKDTEPVPGAGGKTLRQLLQTLGTEWGRLGVHSDVWVSIMEARVRNDASMAWAAAENALIVIPDVRMDNEVAWIRRYGTLLSVRNPRTETHDKHSSERGVDPCSVDYFLVNDGPFDALYEQVEVALRHLGLER